MANVFPVSVGEALSFQEQYLRLIEEFLRSKERESLARSDQQDVKIYDGERLVYGLEDSGVRRDEVSGLAGRLLNPDLVSQLDELRNTPLGEVVSRAGAKRIIVGQRVVLQSDSTGKVIVQELAQQSQQHNDQSLSRRRDRVEPTSPSVRSHSGEKEEQLKSSGEGELKTSKSGLLEESKFQEDTAEKVANAGGFRASVPSTELGIDRKKQEFESGFYPLASGSNSPSDDEAFNKAASLTPQAEVELPAGMLSDPKKAVDESHFKQAYLWDASKEDTESGLDRVLRSLAPLNGELQQFLRLQQQFLHQQVAMTRELVTSLDSTKQELDSTKQELAQIQGAVRERISAPLERSWWQKTVTAIRQRASIIQQRQQQQEAAIVVRELFHRQAAPGAALYRAADYAIAREDNTYTLTDAMGQQLMQFRSTPLGAIVMPETVHLVPRNYQDIKQLSHQISNGELPSGAFSPLTASDRGAIEAQYFFRVNKIASALTAYAASQGGPVEIDGSFFFKWKATPDGNVRIDAKDGRGGVLLKADGKLQTRLTHDDLSYFEQMISALQPASVKSKAQLER